MKLFYKSIKRFLRWEFFDNYCLMYYREKLCTFECQCLNIHNTIISNFLWCTYKWWTLALLTEQWAVRIAHGLFSKVSILALLIKVRTAVDWIRWSGKRHNVRFLWHFPVYFCMNYNKLQRTIHYDIERLFLWSFCPNYLTFFWLFIRFWYFKCQE